MNIPFQLHLEVLDNIVFGILNALSKAIDLVEYSFMTSITGEDFIPLLRKIDQIPFYDRAVAP